MDNWASQFEVLSPASDGAACNIQKLKACREPEHGFHPKTRDQRPSSSAAKDESLTTNPNVARVQGIPTPEIYESPRVTSVSLKKNENTQIQLLDTNFPPSLW